MSDRSEDGFTLIELIASMAIFVIIIGAIGATVMVGLRDATGTDTRLSESHDAQRSSEYFVNDAQSASNVTLNTADGCGDVIPTVSLSWADSGVAKIAAYEVKAGNMRRRFCSGGTLQSDLVVSHFVTSTTASCRPAASCPGRPSKVQVAVTEVQGTATTPYVFTLSGSLRTPQPALALLALEGSSGSALTMNSGSALFTPNGQVAVNSTSTSSIDATLDSLISANTITLNAASCTKCVPENTVPYPPTVATLVADPLAAMVAPPIGTVRTGGTFAGTTTLQPGIYALPITITASANVTFAPGTYYLNGLAINGGTVTGSDVFIYMNSGTFVISAGTVSLSAPTSGSYVDVLVFQSRTNSNNMTITSSTGQVVLDGTVYGPNVSTQAALNGGSAAGTTLQIYRLIADTVTVSNDVGVGS